MRPGPKPLPYTARRVERIILNLYPSEMESLTTAAFDREMKPKDLARYVLMLGLQVMIDEAEADNFIKLLIKSSLNH